MDCVFCSIIEGQIPSRTVSETPLSVSILDAFPLAPGHTLVLPKRHCEKVQDLASDEASDLFWLVRHVISRVDKITGATLVAIHNGKDAGQEIPHLHIHLVPRAQGDSAGAIHSLFGPASKAADGDLDKMHAVLRD